MTRRLLSAAFVYVVLAGAQAAVGAPMRCSGEQTACMAACNKLPTRAALSVCITNCKARQNLCLQTGCWDNGTSRYCGLLRQ